MISLPQKSRTVPELIARAADRYAERTFVTIDGKELTFIDAQDLAERVAAALSAGGMRRGDRIVVMCENRWEMLALWLGCAWGSCVFVPINPVIRGPQFERILANADPRIVALDASLRGKVEALESVSSRIQRIWALGETLASECRGIPLDEFRVPSDRIPGLTVEPSETLGILYTSGTTGPSKGVICPQAQFTWWGELVGGMLDLKETDKLYTSLPLFHINALSTFAQALIYGAELEVGPRFSAQQFLERHMAAEATVAYLLGSMVSVLMSKPRSPLDRAHSLRVCLAPGVPPALWRDFEERFGIRLVESHGMTETNAAIGPWNGSQRQGSMGRVMPGFEARVVNKYERNVPDSTAGELLLRARDPLAFSQGYWRAAEATATSWRDGWFHTCDLVRRDTDGFYFFLDRIKDSIRRRGENISAWEVEQIIARHPAVGGVAVVGVPSGFGDDEVMAFIVPRSEHSLRPAEISAFCEPLVAPFMNPRYIEIVSQLPTTDNGKIQKILLRERGPGPSTWDRQAADQRQP
jgi:carnitine-CoA ligase